jgi:hypothetical protein
MTASAHRYTCKQLGVCQNRTTPCIYCPPQRDRSLTTEPLLLNTERLHRVDASQLPQGAGVSLGHCRTDLDRTPSQGCTGDCDQGRRCTCRFAASTTPHTEPLVPESDRDPAWRAWFWRGYIAMLLAVVASVLWPWLVH